MSHARNARKKAQRATSDIDAAKRCADTVTMHSLAGSVRKWCAIRLIDGGSDGVAYDTRFDAVTHQLHERQCAYVQIPPDGMGQNEALRFLDYHRKLYDAGFRLPDPEFQMPLMPHSVADQRRQIQVLTKGR